MLTIISPAKSLDYDVPDLPVEATQPEFQEQTAELVAILKRQSRSQIGSLMHLSEKLAELNFRRYQDFTPERYSEANAGPALQVFNGDVYSKIEDRAYGKDEWEFAQSHLRILSGLYGLLRPLDLMQPYRLEMGTKLTNDAGEDLYAFWGELLADALNRELATQTAKVLLNLASNEYSKAARLKQINGTVITPVFKEQRGDALKVIALLAKKARGMMVNYIIQNKIDAPEPLKDFNLEGYQFRSELSNDSEWVFAR